MAKPRREVVEPLRPGIARTVAGATTSRCVLDGEIVIARKGALDFDALQCVSILLHPESSS
jgi:ATP-dependent DNA ligase